MPKEKSGPVKTTVKLESKMYEQVRLRCAKERTTLQRLVVRAIADYLKRQ